MWKLSHERHDSKTGEGTTSGQYYAFLQDMITVINNTSKALLSIRRGLFYDGFHFRRDIQLFRERLSEKNVHATIPKDNMGYDQYTVPDTVAVELSFVAFL